MPTTRTERQRPNGPQNTSSPLLSMGFDVLLGPTSTQAEPADAWLPSGVKEDVWFDCASLRNRGRSENSEQAPGRDPTAPFLSFPFVCFPLFVLVHAGLLTRMQSVTTNQQRVLTTSSSCLSPWKLMYCRTQDQCGHAALRTLVTLRGGRLMMWFFLRESCPQGAVLTLSRAMDYW
jgi:hypothetical protein